MKFTTLKQVVVAVAVALVVVACGGVEAQAEVQGSEEYVAAPSELGAQRLPTVCPWENLNALHECYMVCAADRSACTASCYGDPNPYLCRRDCANAWLFCEESCEAQYC